MRKGKYDFFVDTGGTFTDCIARNEEGRLVRRKVLSNGSIRGTIEKWLALDRFQIEEKWELKNDILAGYFFQLMKEIHPPVKIVSFNIQNRTLFLDGPLPEKFRNKKLNFEIYSGDEAPVLGARLITHTPLSRKIDVHLIKLGSTKGTNALLERKGARIVFLVTKGFKDLLRIRYQDRSDIFSREVIKPEPLYDQVVEIDERIDAKGKIVKRLDEDSIREQIRKIKAEGTVESVAVAFMNAGINPAHEEIAQKILNFEGFSFVSISSSLSRLIRYIQRAETSVVNAYLDPVIRQYLENISKKVNAEQFYVMTSSGGLVHSKNFNPKDSLLSGPAGGVVGAVSIGKELGFQNIISFDMGGTSTDVARYGGGFDYRFDLKVGDARIFSHALSIETVAAGGGSLCYFDGYKLCVGPVSAGAFPGPACYGAGGPLTLTDVNLLLGRMDSGQFSIPIYHGEAQKKLDQLVKDIRKKSGKKRDRHQILMGFLDIANEIMAGAIRKVSVAKGYDPSSHTLVAFGGAGGMHAAAIAELLNISTILLPEDAGILSAYGISCADVKRIAEQQVLKPLGKVIKMIPSFLKGLREKVTEQLLDEELDLKDITLLEQLAYLRFKGQEATIEVSCNKPGDLVADFRRKYEQLYGYWDDREVIELESLRVIAGNINKNNKAENKKLPSKVPIPDSYIEQNRAGCTHKFPVYIKQNLLPGSMINGYALVLDKFSTWVVEKGWSLFIEANGTSIMKRDPTNVVIKDAKDAYREIDLELFTNRFMSVAMNMGSMLQRSSVSVNVKERLDFSCALLDAKGELVVNAPHIPVHLGSLGVCVRELAARFQMKEGDTIITNHPAYGGSHLPDITLVTPVYFRGKTLMGYVVNRAHHAEIGGKTPASMPPDAKNLEEEGVVIAPTWLSRNYRPDWDTIRDILSNATYPSRGVQENLADLNAALAANRTGEKALQKLAQEFGFEKVLEYMNLLKQHASLKMHETLQHLNDGTYRAEEFLDDGTPLRVKIDITGSKCRIDLTGTADVHPGNLNATRAIVNGVVIYVLRLLINENIPLNEGLLEPVKIIIPKGMLDPDFPEVPRECPAIVGGNVEVSQRLTDTLLKPFGILACSQGTMNNVLFGNENFSYYETICGGCGAGEGFNGADAVHHHMTNTRITDPEIMEFRYPVRLESFSIRRGSGGKGKWHGGDGVIREFLFMEPVDLSILSQHRSTFPYGLAGGDHGTAGKQFILKSDGTKVKLGSMAGYSIEAGDRFVIYTPGGGGYGRMKVKDKSKKDKK